jgi:ribosomal protein S18 acetylase RimI-like enzyme
MRPSYAFPGKTTLGMAAREQCGSYDWPIDSSTVSRMREEARRAKGAALPRDTSQDGSTRKIPPLKRARSDRGGTHSALEVNRQKSNRTQAELELRVRRIHRRDLNQVWEFLKRVFRDVIRETVEYQRPRLKKHFFEIYEEDGIEQLLFEARQGAKHELLGYAEYAYEIVGSDSWMNQRYFENRGMRPLFVEELAVHPDFHGLGVGSFMLEQIEHAARLRGCTHVVLEAAENNKEAQKFYRKRNFIKLDAAVFLARRLSVTGDLLGPRKIKLRKARKELP